MKAYSNDLRKKIIEAYQRKEGSLRKLAKRFSVSFSFVWRLVKRFRKSGSVAPKPHGGDLSLNGIRSVWLSYGKYLMPTKMPLLPN